MSEKVDQVALALWKLEFHEGRAPIPIPAEDVKIFRERARAAIEAMRTPTDAMLKVTTDPVNAEIHWFAMIDEALK